MIETTRVRKCDRRGCVIEEIDDGYDETKEQRHAAWRFVRGDAPEGDPDHFVIYDDCDPCDKRMEELFNLATLRKDEEPGE